MELHRVDCACCRCRSCRHPPVRLGKSIINSAVRSGKFVLRVCLSRRVRRTQLSKLSAGCVRQVREQRERRVSGEHRNKFAEPRRSSVAKFMGDFGVFYSVIPAAVSPSFFYSFVRESDAPAEANGRGESLVLETRLQFSHPAPVAWTRRHDITQQIVDAVGCPNSEHTEG